MRAKAGDLIYVPSEVLLYVSASGDSRTVKEWRKTVKPEHLLITKVYDGTYEVLYENKYWLVEKSKVYK